MLNARLLAAGVEIAWAPDVRTAHAYPRSARALFADQYRRGRTRAAIRGLVASVAAACRTRAARRPGRSGARFTGRLDGRAGTPCRRRPAHTRRGGGDRRGRDRRTPTLRVAVLSPYPVLPPLHGGPSPNPRAGTRTGRRRSSSDRLLPVVAGAARARAAGAGGLASFAPARRRGAAGAHLRDRVASPLALLSLQPARFSWAAAHRQSPALNRCHPNRVLRSCPWRRLLPADARIVDAAHNVEHDYATAPGRRILRRWSVERVTAL